MNCDSSTRSEELVPCQFGEPSAPRTVVLLGDSIGAQWFSMIAGIFNEPVWRKIVLTKSSCPMVDEDYIHVRSGQAYKICSNWRNSVLDELERIKPDVVVLGSASTYDFNESSWIEGSSRVLKRISAVAATVIVIPGTPSLAFDGPACLYRSRSPEGALDREACLSEDRLGKVAPVTGYLREAAAQFANVHLLDLNDLVCPGQDCNAVSEDGRVVFRDTQHLSDSFVKSRIPLIRDRLEPLLSTVGKR